MFYGIISMQDDATSKAVLQSKHIASDRIYYNTNLNVLANQLRSGDVVWIISVNRFINLSQLKAFAEFCHEKGAGLRFVSQSYLDIWNGHCWRNSFIQLTDRMIMLEQCVKGKMRQGLRLTDEEWGYVYRCLEAVTLEILAQIFSSDGILKRGS